MVADAPPLMHDLPGPIDAPLNARKAGLVLVVAITLAILLGGHPVPALADDGDPHEGRPCGQIGGGEIVSIAFASQAELVRLARRLDVWEVVTPSQLTGEEDGSAADHVIARISAADATWLCAEDIDFEVLPTSPDQTLTIPNYPCYRTVDELYAQLTQWATQYPALTELFSLGTSYEGRPLWVLRLTNGATGLDKPIFFLIANIHGRELITPETAMAFAELLLEGYGVDADVTWLLDQHRIEIMVTANPDGHVRNEAGRPWAYWRKNANPTYDPCSGTDFGVDLNRNSSYHWGGASDRPCEEVYQGPSAASETETRAVETYIRELFPDRRSADDDAPAPDDTSGLFITLHSYGDLVLWPWGYTTTAAAPNAAQLAQFGQKLASFNGYTPQQASALYPTSGTTDDFAYGELGVAAYTFEIGSSFYPSCLSYNTLVQPNLDALLYAAKVARAPYLTPAGPDVLDVSASATLDMGSPIITVTARTDDRNNGGLPIAGAEAYVDRFPWQGGTPIPLAAVDGTFDSAMEAISGTLALTTTVADFTQSRHRVFIRGMDADGAWGPFTAAFVDTPAAIALAPVTATGTGRPGDVVTHTFWLTNTGSFSQTLSLTHTTAQWPTTLVPTHTHLAGLESTPVMVTVSLPEATDHGIGDVLTITVRSEDIPWLAKTAMAETRMLWASLYLPFMIREN